MEDLSGRQLGTYRVLAPLGEGGMAAVYRALQISVNRQVAVKVLPRHYAGDAEFVGRFRREVSILAMLKHPGILSIIDFGESEGYTYIVMPLVDGGTLASRLTGEPLPLPDVTRIIGQVGDALDYAHGKGVVHRDLKPSNILMDERGNCLLSDFGIARVSGGGGRLTMTGTQMGTPTYMSPEQAEGQPGGPASDIYSLGVVLYELVTGRVPFEGDTPIAIAVKHVTAQLPPPRSRNPHLPAAVEAVVLKALARVPADRFATVHDLSAALVLAAAGHAPEPPRGIPAAHATVVSPRSDRAPIPPAEPVPLPPTVRRTPVEPRAPLFPKATPAPPPAPPELVPSAAREAVSTDAATVVSPRRDRTPSPTPLEATILAAPAKTPPAARPVEATAPIRYWTPGRLIIVAAVLLILALPFVIGLLNSPGPWGSNATPGDEPVGRTAEQTLWDSATSTNRAEAFEEYLKHLLRDPAADASRRDEARSRLAVLWAPTTPAATAIIEVEPVSWLATPNAANCKDAVVSQLNSSDDRRVVAMTTYSQCAGRPSGDTLHDYVQEAGEQPRKVINRPGSLALTSDGEWLVRSYQVYVSREKNWTDVTSVTNVRNGRDDNRVQTFVGAEPPYFSADGRVFAVQRGHSIATLDRTTDVADLVPSTTDGKEPSAPVTIRRLSENGRFIVFESLAANLAVGVVASGEGPAQYLYDRTTRALEVINRDPLNNRTKPCGLRVVSLSDDAEWLLFDCAESGLSLLGGASEGSTGLYARHRPSGRTWLVDSIPGSDPFLDARVLSGGLTGVRRRQRKDETRPDKSATGSDSSNRSASEQRATQAVYWMQLPNGGRVTRAIDSRRLAGDRSLSRTTFNSLGCVTFRDTRQWCPPR